MTGEKSTKSSTPNHVNWSKVFSSHVTRVCQYISQSILSPAIYFLLWFSETSGYLSISISNRCKNGYLLPGFGTG